MLGFEPRISGVGSDRSTNWATTTTQGCVLLFTKTQMQSFISDPGVDKNLT